MAWNDSGNGKSPWNQGGDQGPPDLDEVVKKMQERLGSLFGGGGGSGDKVGGFSLGFIAALVLGALLATGFYKIDAPEQGVVLRFGAFQTLTQPGLHWRIPLIDKVIVVNIANTEEYDHQTQMLTTDENIVSIELSVQYRRTDAKAWVFNVRDPALSLSEVSQSAIREVVGTNTAQNVMGPGRTEIVNRTKALLQATLDQYGTGIQIMVVNLVNATPPAQVQAAVDDATRAGEDKERMIFEAEAYENDILPRARGEAVRQIQDAEGHKARVVADAEGETSRFLALLREYQRAPEVTRKRLYLETIQEVYGSVSKVFLDAAGSGNLIYLPVDKLMEAQRRGLSGSVNYGPAAEGSSQAQRDDERASGRTRR
ncbi:MAG: FtsH protease activity modulator HflK [Gammaproteobacteria bacterium]|nr:FtsH protease activity modulator HflK [Gammaproteobacteria bacterium]